MIRKREPQIWKACRGINTMIREYQTRGIRQDSRSGRGNSQAEEHKEAARHPEEIPGGRGMTEACRPVRLPFCELSTCSRPALGLTEACRTSGRIWQMTGSRCRSGKAGGCLRGRRVADLGVIGLRGWKTVRRKTYGKVPGTRCDPVSRRPCGPD